MMQALTVCWVDTLHPDTYLAIVGWPPMLLVNETWWPRISRNDRWRALLLLAGQREEEGAIEYDLGVFGRHPRALPEARSIRTVMAQQTPEWWQAVLGHECHPVSTCC